MNYAGFWPRALALLIDILIWVPFIVLHFGIFYRYSTSTAVLSLLVFGILGFAYPIYFHARWGQTIGKMVAKIKVTQLDGRPITSRHALLRSSIEVLLWVVYTPSVIYVLMTWPELEWSSLSRADKVRLLAERNLLDGNYNVVQQVWLWSELVVILFNKKRRALHDFIAGTVVIHTRLKSVSPKVSAPGVLGMSRRATIFLAVALAVLVIILWSILFAPPPPLK